MRSVDRSPRVPMYWIGCWKGWPDFATNLVEAFVGLPPRQLETHTYILGATGSGKTTVVHHLLAADLRRGHSVLVIDPRGDLSIATLELAARVDVPPERIKYVDLTDHNNPLGFDPLGGNGQPYDRAIALCDAIEAGAESWGVQLSESLRFAAWLLAEAGGKLSDIELVFFDREARRAFLKKVRSEPVAAFWARYDQLSLDRQTVLAGPVLNKISKLLMPTSLRQVFSHSTPVDLSEQLNTPGTVTIIRLGIGQLGSAGWAAGSLLLSAITREIFARTDQPESSRVPVRLYADEFENLQMNSFESLLAEGRKYRASLVVAHQATCQIPSRTRAMLLGNCGVKLIFRCSFADAEVMRKDLGIPRDTIDIGRLRVGEAVLWRRGREPWPIEVNAPLIEDSGRLSNQTRDLLIELERLKPLRSNIPLQSSVASQVCAPQPQARKTKGLEDWLA